MLVRFSWLPREGNSYRHPVMKPLVTPAQIKAIDEKTMETLGLSSFQLMKRVSEEWARQVSADHLTQDRSQTILVLTGPGNNGGDGYCVAEFLRQQGYSVSIFSLIAPASSECKEAERFFQGPRIEQLPSKVDVLIDAIFGSSSRADIPKTLEPVFKGIDRLKTKLRIALDLPSGTDAKTGEAHPLSFRADFTYTIAFPKLGMLDERLMERAGAVRLVCNWFAQPAAPFSAFLLDKEDFLFSSRKPTSHKGEFGRCGVIAGSARTPGAALLAAEAAHRVGAGYVHLFFADHSNPELNLSNASFLFEPHWTLSSVQKSSALVMGCGGLAREWKEILKLNIPTVLDAEALNQLARENSTIALNRNVLLTPHWGEAKRLARDEVSKENRIQMLEHLVETYRAAVYLKGAPGLLKFPDRPEIFSGLHVNSAFAKAGSGDVLSGILGGFLAQPTDGKLNFEGSVISALVFHAALGESIRGLRAVIAGDHLNQFSEAFRALR